MKTTDARARGVLELLDRPWAVLPATLQRIETLASAYLRGEIGPSTAALSRPKRAGGRFEVSDDGVAVLPLHGVITSRSTWLSLFFEETSAESFIPTVAAAIADSGVRAVLLDVDSPGGEALASQQIAAAIFAARGQKPVLSVVTGMMTSGAYWAGAGADKVLLASPVALTGSIGTVLAHVDVSEAEAKRGIKVTEVTAGKLKRAASQHRPLDDVGLAELQRIVNSVNDSFIADVSRFRGMSADQVRGQEARVFVGREGIGAGLADGIEPGFTEALANIPSSAPVLPSAKAKVLPASGPVSTKPTASIADLERVVAKHHAEIDKRVLAMSVTNAPAPAPPKADPAEEGRRFAEAAQQAGILRARR